MTEQNISHQARPVVIVSSRCPVLLLIMEYMRQIRPSMQKVTRDGGGPECSQSQVPFSGNRRTVLTAAVNL